MTQYMTPHQIRNARAEQRRRPATLTERVEVHDNMRATYGDAERIPDPYGRALFLLDADIIRAASKENRP